MKYRVEIRREQTAEMFVEADSKEQAREDAEELAYDLEFEDIWDPEIEITEVGEFPAKAEYWQGGESGGWATNEA